MPLTPKQLAQKFDTDQRVIRKFLRSVTPDDEQPGQGGRWIIADGDVKKLSAKFTEWSKNGATPRKRKDARTADEQGLEANTANDFEDEEDEDFDDIEEPDFEDMEDFEEVDED